MNKHSNNYSIHSKCIFITNYMCLTAYIMYYIIIARKLIFHCIGDSFVKTQRCIVLRHRNSFQITYLQFGYFEAMQVCSLFLVNYCVTHHLLKMWTLLYNCITTGCVVFNDDDDDDDEMMCDVALRLICSG